LILGHPLKSGRRFLVEQIKKRVNDSEEQLMRILLGNCDFFQEPERSDCLEDLKEFGRNFIRGVRQNLNKPAKEICIEFKAC